MTRLADLAEGLTSLVNFDTSYGQAFWWGADDDDIVSHDRVTQLMDQPGVAAIDSKTKYASELLGLLLLRNNLLCLMNWDRCNAHSGAVENSSSPDSYVSRELVFEVDRFVRAYLFGCYRYLSVRASSHSYTNYSPGGDYFLKSRHHRSLHIQVNGWMRTTKGDDLHVPVFDEARRLFLLFDVRYGGGVKVLRKWQEEDVGNDNDPKAPWITFNRQYPVNSQVSVAAYDPLTQQKELMDHIDWVTEGLQEIGQVELEEPEMSSYLGKGWLESE